MTKMFSICGKRVILNMEHSKIGYGYPRVFIETEPEQEYINLDVFLGAPFRMEKKDFEDWAADAQPLEDEAVITEECTQHGVSYETLKKVLMGQTA